MITELRIHDPATTCVPWWAKAKVLDGQDKVEFKPGLNILWGPNGSGKSSIIKAMARYLHCEQGGRQVVTRHSVDCVWDGGEYAMKFGRGDKGFCGGIEVVHGGQAVMYFDPSNKVGIIGGSFDDDFFTQGVVNTMFAGSAGQTTMNRAGEVLMVAMGKNEPPAVEWKVHRYTEADLGDDPNDWKRREAEKHTAIAACLQGDPTIEGGDTLLFDEPDKSLDVPFQGLFWKRMVEVARFSDRQIIAASHSVFALGLPDANYIEMKPGYLEASEAALRGHRLMGEEA